MAQTEHPLTSSIARIRRSDGTIIGLGFLLTGNLVCTCAHVVADALGISREQKERPTVGVATDFPFLGGQAGLAYTLLWKPMQQDGSGDLALALILGNPPSGAHSAHLAVTSRLADKPFEVFGYPQPQTAEEIQEYAVGVWVDDGTIGHKRPNGTVQLQGDKAQGYAIQRGFSGAPVWSTLDQGVAGIITTAESADMKKVAFMIPIDYILREAKRSHVLDLADKDLKQIFEKGVFTPVIGLFEPVGAMRVWRNAWRGVHFSGKAAELSAEQRYAEALENASRAVDLVPTLDDAWLNKGDALTGLQRYDEALEAYNCALAVKPESFAAWSGKGGALAGLQRYDAALEAYDHALHVDQNNAPAWDAKARCYRQMGQFDKALESVEHALAIEPAHADWWDSKGEILVAMGRPRYAVAIYRHVLTAHPQHVRSAALLAQALRVLGDDDEAQATEVKAPELGWQGS